MSVTLNNIADNKGASQKKLIVGRGIGSGKGKTCGSGQKGQKARTGVAIKGFEGGQMPIFRRVPKRGFTNPTRVEYNTINLGDIQRFVDAKRLDAKKTINAALLAELGITQNTAQPLKILGKGELKAGVTVEAHAASKSAQAAIEKAGGKITLVDFRKEQADAKKAAAEKKEVKGKAAKKKAAAKKPAAKKTTKS